MTGHRKIWITLIIASAFFLIANAPASILKPYLKNSLNFPFDISGTMLQGSISSQYFHKASWKIDPVYFLLAKISAKITVKIDSSNQISTDAEISPSKNLKLSNIKGTITTQYLQQFFQNTPFLFNSTIQINRSEAVWDKQNPPSLPSEVNGILLVKAVNLLGEDLGDYHLNFIYSDQSLNGAITSTKNSAVNGELKLNISPQNLLTVSGQILPKTKELKLIFKNLNIKLSPILTYQLSQ